MLDHTEYSHSSEATETEIYSSTTPPATVRKKRSKNKKRFSDKQIKSLESMFETESRLEPLKKLQLARELGLQPRQVSIWFQNKRARWKSKQLERDYNILRASYNNLASSFDALKKEQQALLIQLQKLNDRMQKPLEQTRSCTQNKAAKNKDTESENGDTIKSDLEVKPSLSTERSEHIRGVFLNGDSSIISEEAACFCLDDQPGLLNFAEHAGGFLTSPEDWGMLNSDDLLDQSTSDYQLWDF